MNFRGLWNLLFYFLRNRCSFWWSQLLMERSSEVTGYIIESIISIGARSSPLIIWSHWHIVYLLDCIQIYREGLQRTTMSFFDFEKFIDCKQDMAGANFLYNEVQPEIPWTEQQWQEIITKWKHKRPPSEISWWLLRMQTMMWRSIFHKELNKLTQSLDYFVASQYFVMFSNGFQKHTVLRFLRLDLTVFLWNVSNPSLFLVTLLWFCM